MSLNQFLNHLEQSYVYNAIADKSKAKSEAISAIKILNQLAKTNKNSTALKSLSQFILNYYESLNQNIALSEKLLWLSSKLVVDGVFYYPLVEFDTNLDSRNVIFFDKNITFQDKDSSLTTLPNDISFNFKPIESNNWSDEKSNLMNLYQDLLANCSFVSSFLALVAVNHHIISIISPHTPSSCCKITLTFNGCRRVVEIDNRLPLSPDSDRNLILKSFSDSELYWPAFIEKAYLKVMGYGYLFKGSNMANDTYLLSGWIPEIIKLKDGSKIKDFKDLWYLNQKGLVTLGLGTGKLSETISSQLGLIGQHDYLIEEFNEDSITLKNPWVQDNLASRNLKIDNLVHFGYLYINWKPKSNINKYQENFLYVKKEQMSIIDETQYSVSCEKETWVLIERHLPVNHDFWMRINVYCSSNKVISPIQQKEYSMIETNNRLQLVKLDPGSYTILISANESAKFSIISYGSIIIKSTYSYDHLQLITGEWDSDSCGGNWKMSSYIENPQYDLVVNDQTELTLSLYSQLPINFHLFHSDKSHEGFRIRTFDHSKLISDEKYNLFFQSTKLILSQGSYKLVVSNFDCQLGQYKFLINSSNAVTCNKTPTKLSLFNTTRTFLWNNTNRHKLYFTTDNLNTSIIFKINHFNDPNVDFNICTDYRPAMRASVFNGLTKQPILINEEFNNDILYGLFVDLKLENVGEYILLIERFESGIGKCVVEIASDKKVTVT
ncbi:RIM13 [Candida jiufengensis]|uniref:RIM13 n=1 Tax=Candida jiufengensis TaxID=497108 RepID=UPI0022253973|nr:RIM13 [Candida jiufengensis]KAI5956350.1 RIM13 [Candida jiufengensis]